MQAESPFQQVASKQRLVDRVVDEIQRLIIEGRLAPGQRLPPERGLADQLGVSRTVVREGVHILVTKGLLESRQGIGTSVRNLTNQQITEPLSLLLQSKGISLENLHEVRAILEGEIAFLASRRIVQADIRELEALVERMATTQGSKEGFADADAGFHQLLARSTRNPLLAVLLDSIRDLMQEVRLSVSNHPELRAQSLADHRQIMERIAAGDAEGARDAMLRHVENARRIQEEVLAVRAARPQ